MQQPNQPDLALDQADPDRPASGDAAGDRTRVTEPRPPDAARSRWHRWLPRVVIALVLLLVLALGWLAVRGYQAGRALLDAEPTARSVQSALGAGDLDAAAAALPALQAATDVATTATTDPVWRAAGALPWLGPQLRAVADVSSALDLLADDVLDPLVQTGTALELSGLTPVDGVIDLAPLEAVAGVIDGAADAAARAAQVVADIDPEPLVGPLANRLGELRLTLADGAATLGTARDVAAVLPPMLGADGPRTYLLLFLNNAELRTAGGIVGAVGVLSADAGRVELIGYRAAADVPRWAEPVLPLDPGEEAVHSALLGRVLQNVTMSPHFPRTAELAAQMWLESQGQAVDGVLAVDPVALSYVLAATGPVTAGGTELSSETVVDELLSATYLEIPDPAQSDEFFAGAASAVFGMLTTGRPTPQALLNGLTRGAGEGRISVWSRHGDEQAVLGAGPLGGAFFDEVNASAVGVFLDDRTAGKMDYYLDSSLTVEGVTCRAEGAATATLVLDLRSRAPQDPSALPEYVTGSAADVERGSIGTNITVYAPVGGHLVGARLGQSGLGGRSAVEAGRDAMIVGSTLAPGQDQTFRFDVQLAPGTTELAVWSTPALGMSGRTTVPVCSVAGPNG